jgi:ATP-dependent exoDNAse (exonuclease V) alpha subunit
MTFERVLIIPTVPIAKFIASGAYLEANSACSFYVAVTRAKQSVAIVLDKAGTSSLPFWKPAEVTAKGIRCGDQYLPNHPNA